MPEEPHRIDACKPCHDGYTTDSLHNHGAKKCGPCGRGDYDHDYDGSSSNAASTTKCISCGDGYITQRTGAGYNVVTDSAATRCEPCNAGQYGTSSFSVASRFLALRRHG